MTEFERLTRRYLSRFQAVVKTARTSGISSVEMVSRPVVHNFIEQLVRMAQNGSDECVIHHDTTTSPGNRPDWRFEDPLSFGIYMYGEQKNLSANRGLRLSRNEKDQILRYLTLGRPVFVFDGIEFLILDSESDEPFNTARRLSLIPKPLTMESDWGTLQINSDVEVEFRDLLREPGFHRWTESDLVEQLAIRARLISETIKELLTAPVGSGTDSDEELLLANLHTLQRQLAVHHDSNLSGIDACSEFVAQALIFGMFYAHTQAPIDSSTHDRREVIRSFWTEDSYLEIASKLRPFHNMAKILESSLGSTNGLGAWYHDTATFLAHAEYLGTNSGPSDFHALYERFLSVFNPGMRFDYGAWYTPKPLSNWMNRFVDAVCRETFGVGMAQSTDKVIDPCVGTGSFLESFIELTDPNVEDPPELIGFEILPAPYALAQYRLAIAAYDTQYRDHIHLFLTDTLADGIESPPLPAASAFDQEVIDASSYANPPLRLVIGNPPSSITSSVGSSRKLIEAKMEIFRPPARDRTDRQNTQKAINNEAYRFLRWCADHVLVAERGILALVLPGSFIHSVSLRYAREWIISKFDDIWVIEIDEDARNGSGTSSIFNVLQGRSAIFATQGSASKLRRHANISALSYDEKIEFLNSPVNLTTFQEVLGAPDQLAPRAPYPREKWLTCWPLSREGNTNGIFKLKCSGIKLAPTSVLFHSDQNQLVRRSRSIASLPFKSFQELKDEWFQGQARPPRESKFSDEVRREIGKAVEPPSSDVYKYTFRPFVQGYAIINDDLFTALSRTDGGGTRARPEIRAAFQQGSVALGIAPGPRDLGSTLTRFVSFAWTLPDNDNASRGNSMFYADRYPEFSAGSRTWDPTVIQNTSDEIRSLFSTHDDPGRATLFYIYATMSSPEYLEAFEPVLYVGANPDTPFRVPIAANEHIRCKLVTLGGEMAECENWEAIFPHALSMEVEWPDAIQEFQLREAVLDSDQGSISLHGANDEIVSLRGIPARCLVERISGHNVVAKWLRERTFAYLRRTFRQTDLDNLQELISRLEHQLVLIDEANLYVQKLLADDRLLIAPPARVLA